MSYYDSSKDGKCHGSIPIREIEKVEEAEPQGVPINLKQGEAGFFFTVSISLRCNLSLLQTSSKQLTVSLGSFIWSLCVG